MVQEGLIMNNKRNIILFCLIGLGFLSIILVIQFVLRYNKQQVVLDILPNYSTITINGKTYKNGSIYLEPGKYSAEISAEGFEKVTEVFTLAKSSPSVLKVSLAPNSQVGYQWVNNNENLYGKREEEGAIESRRLGTDLINAQSIVEFLPYRGKSYSIGYRTPDGTPDSLIITITAGNSLSRELALSRIKNWGYDPADLPIQFVGYQNPLSSTRSESGGENE